MTIAPYICPCCRQPAERPGIESMVRELPVMQGALLRVLLAKAGTYIKSERIIAAVWPCRYGGLSRPDIGLSILAKALNGKLDGTGWRVEVRRYSGYRLVRHEQ